MGNSREELVDRALAFRTNDRLKVLNLLLEAYETGADEELAQTITQTLEWCDKLFD